MSFLSPLVVKVRTWRLVVALFLVIIPQAAAETITGLARVIDGDTITIEGTRIRLHGIDAPELDQRCMRGGQPYRCGEESKSALRRIIGAAVLTCAIRGADRYGRVVATCARERGSKPPLDVARELVAEGWAVAFTRYSNVYVAEERRARELRRGLWAGDFVRPADWRRQRFRE